MSDEQKKLVVLGVLGLALVGVGAFTLAPAPAPAKPLAPVRRGPLPGDVKDEKTVAAADQPFALPRRNPFKVPEFAQPVDPSRGPIAPPRPEAPMPRGVGGNLPSPFAETIPVNPDEPATSPDRRETPPGQTPATPPPPPLPYTLIGVVAGARPAAVFRDAQGNQRLTLLGGSLDGDTRLIDVQPHSATVEYHGEPLTLGLKGEPLAK